MLTSRYADISITQASLSSSNSEDSSALLPEPYSDSLDTSVAAVSLQNHLNLVPHASLEVTAAADTSLPSVPLAAIEVQPAEIEPPAGVGDYSGFEISDEDIASQILDSYRAIYPPASNFWREFWDCMRQDLAEDIATGVTVGTALDAPVIGLTVGAVTTAAICAGVADNATATTAGVAPQPSIGDNSVLIDFPDIQVIDISRAIALDALMPLGSMPETAITISNQDTLASLNSCGCIRNDLLAVAVQHVPTGSPETGVIGSVFTDSSLALLVPTGALKAGAKEDIRPEPSLTPEVIAYHDDFTTHQSAGSLDSTYFPVSMDVISASIGNLSHQIAAAGDSMNPDAMQMGVADSSGLKASEDGPLMVFANHNPFLSIIPSPP